MKHKILTIVMLILMISGCSTFVNKRQFIKTYDGPVVTNGKGALLKPAVGVVIEGIDGDKSKRFTAIRAGASNIDADISFIPGPHELRISYFVNTPAGSKFSKESKIITFIPTAGRRYILTVEESLDSKTWQPKIIDVTEKHDLWCLWVYGKCMNDRFNKGQSPDIPQSEIN